MSDQDIKQISALTGTFAALKPASEKAQPGNAESENGKELPQPVKTNMEVLAKKLNIASQAIGRDLRFEVDMESGRSVIQVLDSETGEIIRQIPPENAETYLSDAGDVALRLYDSLV
ncbi:MAG: flagellar protein FlaG [Gammaproteobacteria bacterium]|nr:flagellar protein FlaG [Gammaproteobacteria bacterium]